MERTVKSKELEILLDVWSELLYGGKFWRLLPWDKERVVKAVLKSLDQTIEYIEEGRLKGTHEEFSSYYEARNELIELKLPRQEIGRTN